MNIDNINTLIAHVEGLTEPRKSWEDAECFRAMVQEIAGLDTSIEAYLGVNDTQADRLSYRTRSGNDDMHDIANLPLDEQKRVMVHALTSLRDTGAVEWLA